MAFSRFSDLFYIAFGLSTLIYYYGIGRSVISFAFLVFFWVFMEKDIFKNFKNSRDLAAEEIGGGAKFDAIMDKLGLDMRKRRFPDQYSFILLGLQFFFIHQLHYASTGNIFRDVVGCDSYILAPLKACGYEFWHYVMIDSFVGLVGFFSCWHLASYLVVRFKILR